MSGKTYFVAVEKMIAKVMKKKEFERSEAIDYMLVVATGRLAALWRYDDSLPEGKKTKGILALSGRKKRAPKSPKIAPVAAPAEAPEKPAKSAKKRKPKTKTSKSVKERLGKAVKAVNDGKQLEIADAVAE